MNKRLVGSVVAILAVAVLAIVIIAMQKDDSSTTDKNTDETSSTSQNTGTQNQSQPSDSGSGSGTEPTDTPVASAQVDIEDFAFSSAVITIKKGTTVTWTNKDSAAHTVTGTDNKKGPESDLLENGDTYTFTFEEAGTFNYFCAPHPHMKGQVIVE